MYQQSTVTMTMRELDRLKVIQAVVGGELRVGAAAERLGISTRQVRRLTERYRLEGPVGLISRLRNRPSNRRLQEPLENQIARILRDQYPDFGPTLAMEKLAERHQIVVAKETVRRIQVAAGLWIPRRLRPAKIQQPRMRRACVGELVQIDGCEHRWFEDRGPMCTALVFVDDATSRLMVVLFTRPGLGLELPASAVSIEPAGWLGAISMVVLTAGSLVSIRNERTEGASRAYSPPPPRPAPPADTADPAAS